MYIAPAKTFLIGRLILLYVYFFIIFFASCIFMTLNGELCKQALSRLAQHFAKSDEREMAKNAISGWGSQSASPWQKENQML